MVRRRPYYGSDLAWVHHVGFGQHADRCAPGVLAWLEPVRRSGGLVVELGCGSGLLTRHLVEAGHRVIATDASQAMLQLTREVAPQAEAIRPLRLPDDPVPACDAIVSVGHVLSYLADEDAVERALVACAKALRPGGVLAIDLCDLRWGERLGGWRDQARVEDTWAIITRYSRPRPSRFVRDITTFVRNDDGSWRRDDERHDNVLIDTGRIPALLARRGLDVHVGSAFGNEQLPEGLVTIVGRRAASGPGAERRRKPRRG